MVLELGTIIPFQFGDIKRLVRIDWQDRFGMDLQDLNYIIFSNFGVSNYKLYNKKIGFEIPEELILLYLEQRNDYTNFVIEIVEIDANNVRRIGETISEPVVEDSCDEDKSDDFPPAKKRKQNPHDDLQEVLDTPEGEKICQYHDLHHRLNDEQRSVLVKLLTTHEIKKILMLDAPLAISDKRYLYLANSIVERFPDESAKTYYHAPFKNLVLLANGKLHDEFYSNKCQYLKNVRDSRYCESGISVESDFPELDELSGLKTEWKHYFQAWQQTFHLRMLYIEIIEDPLKYYSKFIRGIDYDCVKLIEYDFERLHPGKGAKLLDNWEQISERIFTEALVSCRNDVPLILDMYGNMPQLSSFMMFSYFFENYECDVRPFKKENLRNLVIHIDTIADDPIEAMGKYYNEQRGRKPRVFVTGNNAEELRCYVFVDNSVYLVDTILKAVDFCFKCYHVLHLPYIPEQKEAWELLQQSVYGIYLEETDVERQPFLDVLQIT